jgi:hypothetical protein
VTKVKLMSANGVVRWAKATTFEAAIAKVKKYAAGTAITNVAVRGA